MNRKRGYFTLSRGWSGEGCVRRRKAVWRGTSSRNRFTQVISLCSDCRRHLSSTNWLFGWQLVYGLSSVVWTSTNGYSYGENPIKFWVPHLGVHEQETTGFATHNWSFWYGKFFFFSRYRSGKYSICFICSLRSSSFSFIFFLYSFLGWFCSTNKYF